MRTIKIGKYLQCTIEQSKARVSCDSPSMRRHLKMPWYIKHLEQEVGASLSRESCQETEAEWPCDLSERHNFITGSTGSGKSVAIGEVIRQQLEAGLSVVAAEPKDDRVRKYVQLARAAGLPPECVTVISPRYESIPGWNIFGTDAPICQSAGDFAAVVERLSPSNAPRMNFLCANAALVAAAHNLSIFELLRLLQREDYRAWLLTQPLPDGKSEDDRFAYEEARSFFENDFSAWSKSDQSGSVSPINTRLQEVLRHRFLASFLLARTNTIDLASLWQRQQLIVLHLDDPSLGPTATRLLAGLLARSLFRTAMRTSGPIRIMLVLDELATVDQLIGDVLIDAIAIARSRGLQLLCGTQYLEQLSEQLRRALNQCAVMLRFRIGSSDSSATTSVLASDTDTFVSSLTVAEKPALHGKLRRAEVSHVLSDAKGGSLRARYGKWEALEAAFYLARDPISTLCRLACTGNVPELYVKHAQTGELTSLKRYAAGVSRYDMKLRGPAPLRIGFLFPEPKVTKVERCTTSDLQTAWFKILSNLKPRQCILKIPGSAARLVEVNYVEDTVFSQEDGSYLARSQAMTSQGRSEIDEMIRWRRSQVEPNHSKSKLGEKEDYDDDESLI